MDLCACESEEHEHGVGAGANTTLVKKEKIVVYYESIKRELQRRPIYECRCDERLKLKLRGLHASHTLGCSGDWNT
jgi:hypothetical protein